MAICASDVGVLGTNAMHREANASRILANHSGLLECVIDALNRVVPHREQEA